MKWVLRFGYFLEACTTLWLQLNKLMKDVCCTMAHIYYSQVSQHCANSVGKFWSYGVRADMAPDSKKADLDIAIAGATASCKSHIGL